MAKPKYDDGYEEERSDIADTFEGRQEKIARLKKLKEEEEENLLNTLEQEDTYKPKIKRGLSKVFYLSFAANPLSKQQKEINNKVKKKNLRPSSRQRRKTLNKTTKEPLLQEKEDSLPIPKPTQRPPATDMLSRIGSTANQSSFEMSYKSFNFDEEATTTNAPPQFIPAYYEYQQRLLRQRQRRRYAWELAFFGVYRRNPQLDDDIQTEILSVST